MARQSPFAMQDPSNDLLGAYLRGGGFSPVSDRTLTSALEPFGLKLNSFAGMSDTDVRSKAVQAVLKRDRERKAKARAEAAAAKKAAKAPTSTAAAPAAKPAAAPAKAPAPKKATAPTSAPTPAPIRGIGGVAQPAPVPVAPKPAPVKRPSSGGAYAL